MFTQFIDELKCKYLKQHSWYYWGDMWIGGGNYDERDPNYNIYKCKHCQKQGYVKVE